MSDEFKKDDGIHAVFIYFFFIQTTIIQLCVQTLFGKFETKDANIVNTVHLVYMYNPITTKLPFIVPHPLSISNYSQFLSSRKLFKIQYPSTSHAVFTKTFKISTSISSNFHISYLYIELGKVIHVLSTILHTTFKQCHKIS